MDGGTYFDRGSSNVSCFQSSNKVALYIIRSRIRLSWTSASGLSISSKRSSWYRQTKGPVDALLMPIVSAFTGCLTSPDASFNGRPVNCMTWFSSWMALKMFLGTVCDLIGFPWQQGEKRQRFGPFCQISWNVSQNSRWKGVVLPWCCMLDHRRVVDNPITFWNLWSAAVVCPAIVLRRRTGGGNGSKPVAGGQRI